MPKDIYGEPEIFKRGNVIAKVYSPILTSGERERRMDAIRKAAADLALAHYLHKKAQQTER